MCLIQILMKTFFNTSFSIFWMQSDVHHLLLCSLFSGVFVMSNVSKKNPAYLGKISTRLEIKHCLKELFKLHLIMMDYLLNRFLFLPVKVTVDEETADYGHPSRRLFAFG